MSIQISLSRISAAAVHYGSVGEPGNNPAPVRVAQFGTSVFLRRDRRSAPPTPCLTVSCRQVRPVLIPRAGFPVFTIYQSDKEQHLQLPIRFWSQHNIELSSRAESKRESQFCRQPKVPVEAGIAADCSNDLLGVHHSHRKRQSYGFPNIVVNRLRFRFLSIHESQRLPLYGSTNGTPDLHSGHWRGSHKLLSRCSRLTTFGYSSESSFGD